MTTAEEDLKRTALIDEFRAMASRYNAPGWIEYLFWETLQGLRDRPFAFLDPLPDEEVEVLRMLRDDEKIWLFYRDNQWFMVDIEEWKKHASVRTSKDVRFEMDAACHQAEGNR